MKNSKLLKLVLLVSGLIAIGIGSAILFVPATFYATYGIELGSDASLANEIRAPGGALLAMGVLIVAGVFVAELTFASTVIAAVLCLSYGLSRLMSMATDGLPDGGLVGAAAFEFAIGAASLLALLRARKTSSRQA